MGVPISLNTTSTGFILDCREQRSAARLAGGLFKRTLHTHLLTAYLLDQNGTSSPKHRSPARVTCGCATTSRVICSIRSQGPATRLTGAARRAAGHVHAPPLAVGQHHDFHPRISLRSGAAPHYPVYFLRSLPLTFLICPLRVLAARA